MDPGLAAGQLGVMSPIIQYGFAGLCVVLLVIIVWLIRRLLGILEKTNEVIAANTAAIRAVDAHSYDSLMIVRGINDKLLARPCIAEK